MSILPLLTNGMRSGEPTCTISRESPILPAIALAMSTSTPSISFLALKTPSGGSVGLMPTMSFFDAMISSSVRAAAIGAASVATTATPTVAPANHDCNLFICPLLSARLPSVVRLPHLKTFPS